jgi:quinol monooxygenase YgiN
MSRQISWRLVLAIKPGPIDEFQALTAEMVESTRTEIGTLIYERFISEDRQFLHGYERYADSRAAVDHLEHFSDRFDVRLLSLAVRIKLSVYGTPDAKLKELLDAQGARYFAPFGDLAYWP